MNLVPTFTQLFRPRRVVDSARRPELEQVETVRPVGTRFEKVVAGSPLDPRSRPTRLVYEVTGHQTDAEGMVREVVRLVRYEKVRAG